MVKILDCTTRDGGFCTNWEFDTQYVNSLIDCQKNTGISYFEIGYRNFFDKNDKGEFFYCDKNFLTQFCNNKEDLQIGVMVDVNKYNAQDFVNGIDDKIDFVRIATHPKDILQALLIAEELHSKNYKIFLQLMEAQNIDATGYITLFQWQNKNILESLYFADSYGTMTAKNVEEIYNKLKVIGFDTISFHAHNNNNMAFENTIKAIELGAYSIDITHNGIGRGGNLNATMLLNSLGWNSNEYKNLDDIFLKN